MINIITNAELYVISKQRSLVEKAICPDGAYAMFNTKLIVDINTNETIESFTNGDLIEFYGGSGTFKSDAAATVIAIHDAAVSYPVIRAM